MRLTVPPELVEAAKSGQGNGMERLLETLWPHAYRIARSVVQNDALAEDAAQEACAIIYREIAQLRSADAFRAWAYRIVVREALRVAKHQAPVSGATESDAEDDIDARLDTLRALAALSAELRAVAVLHYYADLSSAEIGSILRVPSATVRFRLSQARKRLKQILSADNTPFTMAEASR
ncbi:MAG TPA: RNA polymerase sigma factor [Candidatus Baltobacteraceae bacterium]|nr:RNA polymerase sigma factor [Candidatus Baltobacteraceae bacterium]